jgi:hypothetical protein
MNRLVASSPIGIRRLDRYIFTLTTFLTAFPGLTPKCRLPT